RHAGRGRLDSGNFSAMVPYFAQLRRKPRVRQWRARTTACGVASPGRGTMETPDVARGLVAPFLQQVRCQMSDVNLPPRVRPRAKRPRRTGWPTLLASRSLEAPRSGFA